MRQMSWNLYVPGLTRHVKNLMVIESAGGDDVRGDDAKGGSGEGWRDEWEEAGTGGVLGGERAVFQVQSLGSSGVMDRLCERKRYHLFDCGTVSDL